MMTLTESTLGSPSLELPKTTDSDSTIVPNPRKSLNEHYRCASPTSSESSVSISNSSTKYQGRRYNGKLPITEIPELVELCQQFLKSQNITGLSMIARQAGLPPHLRHKIWPLLLKSHPFVQNPYVEIDLDDYEERKAEPDGDENHDVKGTSGDIKSYTVPIKEIRFDLRKYLRSAERYYPKTITHEIKDMFEIQGKIFDVIENAIIKFLKKWGSIIHYNSSLTWIALGLAEWVPPLENSQFVLCGRDDIARNGTKLRNINDNYFEKITRSTYSSETSSTTFDSPYTHSPVSFTPSASPMNTPPIGHKPMSFAEIYERMALVILHSPDPAQLEDSKKYESTQTLPILKDSEHLSISPYLGGTIKDRVSFFLSCMRKLLPELHSYMAEEDCLNGDWLLWWLKYDGSKVWSRYDRGRTWDLILGYRSDIKNFESDMKELSELTSEQIHLLGQDLFWTPLDGIKEEENGNNKPDNLGLDSGGEDDDVNGDEAIDEKQDETLQHFSKPCRSESVLTISKSENPLVIIEKTPTFGALSLDSLSSELPSLDDIEPIHELPFSKVHPHIEIIFISLAFLKSKEYTITELDQSEIKTLLNRLSSLKTDSGEMNSFVNTNDENQRITNIHSQHNHENSNGERRKSNRDIENILVEAGELWRKFLYIYMMEESDLEK